MGDFLKWVIGLALLMLVLSILDGRISPHDIGVQIHNFVEGVKGN